jgi:asparagine synthetase B (glutamine-hydrolysing)
VTALTPLERASGLVLGNDEPDCGPPTAPDPRTAMERALVEPLRRSPCLVSFSGGRDSSAVLAVAAAVARREGLPLPIPASLRFPRAEDSAETEWQEEVVAHLGLEEWIRLEMTNELDCVGPVATQCLARHGVLWPSNAHFHAPLFAHARGGSFLTGIGGDEVLGSSRWLHARRVLSGRVRPRPRDVLALGLALAPPRVRRLVTRRRMRAPFPWLHPHAVAEIARQLADDEAAAPLRWSAGIRFAAGQRYLHVGTSNLALLAADDDVNLIHPFLDRGFVAALAALPRAQRFHRRRDAMDLLFGDVLPEAVRWRRTKASFDGAFWHEHSRELVGRWSGEGIDLGLIDVERLREQWESAAPDPRTYTLLQFVKVAVDLRQSPGERGDQAVARLVEPAPASRPAELPAG